MLRPYRPSTTRTYLAFIAIFSLLFASGLLLLSLNRADASAGQIVATARAQVGTPYQWGGDGPNSFDCSGFVKYVAERHGVTNMPRNSAEQQRWATRITRSQLRVGDLVFFRYSGRNGGPGVADHVKLYVGNGQVIGTSTSRGRVIEAAIHTTAVVSYGRMPGLDSGVTSSDRPTRAASARRVADTLDLRDRPNPFGVVTEGGAVGAVHHAGIAYPYADGLFRPHHGLTRYQLTVWLQRSDATRREAAEVMQHVLGLPSGDAVTRVREARIAYPYADGTFRPNSRITDRQVELWVGRSGY